MAKSTFGNVRQLKSGKFQARYTGPDGQPCEIPSFAALPALPESWVDRLQTGHRATAAKAPARGYKEALTWLESRVFAGNSRNPHTFEGEEGSRY
ncbi:MAG TPA: hypothetical protein K8V93_12950, partial [Corynebacterium pollutisoli]|nr:hypothetical protein [Corynebacterium pollutisoli]